MSGSNRQSSSSSSSSGKRKSSGSPARASTSVGAAKKPKRRKSTARADETHYVEKILKKRYVNGRAQLLLKWQGYSMEESTWEPIENLTGDCMRMLADFEAELFAEQCKRARCKTDASMMFTALNDSSPSSSSIYVEENSPSAASLSATASPASINARLQLIQMPSPIINLVEVKQEAEREQPQLEEQAQVQTFQGEQSRERISQAQQMQEQQPQEERIQQKEMPRKEITLDQPAQKQQLQEQQPPALQLLLPTPKTSPKLCEELNLSSDSSSASDSDSSSSSSGSGSSSNSSSNSKSSKKGDLRKRSAVQPPVSNSNPFFINLDLPHKLNLSSEDDTDDEVEVPATGPASIMERQEVSVNSGYAKSSIETLKEQARRWHESKGKASEKSGSRVPPTVKPAKQPTARPETQPTPTQPSQPKLLAIPNRIKEQWLKTSNISPETPKSRRRMTMHVDSVEEAMEQIHGSGSSMNRRMSLDRSRSRSNNPPTSNGRFKNVNSLNHLENSPKRCKSADKSRMRAKIAPKNLSKSSPIIEETLAPAAEPLHSMPSKPLSPKPSPLPSTPKTPVPSSMSSVGGSSGSSASTTRGGSATSHISQVGNWDDSLHLPARPQGIERGLALEKILKSFKMRGETYLVVKWKTVSALDAVLLSGVIELYPHIVIEYFEKLQLRSPLD
ncbi:chromo domain-containing protein rhino-like [Drosophila montana]|uniref:chromo domain-containing protein rhino-like n=1 Tax=Drosophila montana TaxID=40370 RepID=UPI00313D0391